MNIFTLDSLETRFHCVSMGCVSFRRMYELLIAFKGKYDNIIGFQPTGWAFGKSIANVTRRRNGNNVIYGVPYRYYQNVRSLISCLMLIAQLYSLLPVVVLIHSHYSEHSSYNELKEFVSWLKPKTVIPTVDCDTEEKVKVCCCVAVSISCTHRHCRQS